MHRDAPVHVEVAPVPPDRPRIEQKRLPADLDRRALPVDNTHLGLARRREAVHTLRVINVPCLVEPVDVGGPISGESDTSHLLETAPNAEVAVPTEKKTLGALIIRDASSVDLNLHDPPHRRGDGFAPRSVSP